MATAILKGIVLKFYEVGERLLLSLYLNNQWLMWLKVLTGFLLFLYGFFLLGSKWLIH